jgi:hypothetical protein
VLKPEAFFLSRRDILPPSGRALAVKSWFWPGVLGLEVSGVGTGVESALVSYKGRWGFCRATGFGASSSALSLSVLDSGVVSLMLGAPESLAPSNSCICRSKYEANLSQLTTLLCSVLSCSP